MDEEIIITLIKSTLNRYRIEDFDTIKFQNRNHLISIETYFQKCIKVYQDCIIKLDKINLSIRGVCNNSNVGKSTVYQNKDILYAYVENRIKEIEETFDMFKKKKVLNLENKNTQLLQRLDNMIVDYIENTNLKFKVEELYKETEKLQKQKNALAQERLTLINTNNQLSLELSKARNNIIELHHQ